VIASFFDWLDHRTGYRTLLSAMLLEDIPGGARWRYVWGSTLVFVFTLQLVTGICLMTAYSPGDTSAWASVHFIQYHMDFGWLIRGLHHFGSQTMMVLLALHMLQVVIAGAHLPPREVNWWLGLALLGVTFGLSLTGYLLPWDQKGYWATRVATNIARTTPVIGDFLKRLLIGGDDYGNHTLTRFYALHVSVLPLALIGLMVAHITLFRRHGVTAPAHAEGEDLFWPRQAFRDLIACLAVFAVMVGLVVFGGQGHAVDIPDEKQPANLYEDWAHKGQKGMGANLDAPADRDTQNYPARPEWYFFFLFQLLKYFEGDHLLIGTFVIPNAALALLFLLPLLGYGGMRKFGHFFSIMVMFSLVGAAGLLTLMAMADDSPELLDKIGNRDEKKREKAESFQKSVRKAEELAARAVNLAMAGVPDDGARTLLRHDPLTRGHELFRMNCAVCHKFTKKDCDPFEEDFTRGTFKASDLGDFASEGWIRGLLRDPSDPKYFGLTEQTGMKKWRKGVEKERKKMKPDDIAEQDADFDLIARFLADQATPPAKRDKDFHARGMEAVKRQECTSCHTLGEEKDGRTAPDLTDYGSIEWIRFMVMEPGSKARYGSRNEMPAFRNKEGPASEVALKEFMVCNPDFPANKIIHLGDVDRELILRFVTRDYRVVFGGRVIAAAPK
jgi:ubiquinol-cytochrome c reductase cytochrome b subunit